MLKDLYGHQKQCAVVVGAGVMVMRVCLTLVGWRTAIALIVVFGYSVAYEVTVVGVSLEDCWEPDERRTCLGRETSLCPKVRRVIALKMRQRPLASTQYVLRGAMVNSGEAVYEY